MKKLTQIQIAREMMRQGSDQRIVSQQYMADHIGIHVSTISNLETRVAGKSSKLLQRGISEFLGVPVRQLFTAEGRVK